MNVEIDLLGGFAVRGRRPANSCHGVAPPAGGLTRQTARTGAPPHAPPGASDRRIMAWRRDRRRRLAAS
jgi:hypothetical protein